jgi:DNA-binding NtrC family response regulator
MNIQNLSAVALREEKHRETIEPVPIPKERSWQKSAGKFSGKQSLGIILVVNDVPAIRKLIRFILENVGYDILEAEDSQDAIGFLNRGESSLVVDTIITDLNIPKVDGFEVMAYCKTEYPKVPFIVLTRIADVPLATSLIGQGISDYLVKPVEAKKLIASVENALAQRQLSWA